MNVRGERGVLFAVESTRKGLVLWSLAAVAFVAIVLLAFPATQAGSSVDPAQPSPVNAK